MKSVYPIPQSWKSIANYFEHIVSHSTTPQTPIPEFQSLKTPRVSITEYIHRIHMYAKCSDSCLVLAFIYVDRLVKGDVHLVLTQLNIYR